MWLYTAPALAHCAVDHLTLPHMCGTCIARNIAPSFLTIREEALHKVPHPSYPAYSFHLASFSFFMVLYTQRRAIYTTCSNYHCLC